jgi:hypothetical protein
VAPGLESLDDAGLIRGKILLAFERAEEMAALDHADTERIRQLLTFVAWWFWRSVYLMKLPRLAKKLRIMASWTLDLFFGQEIEQMITVRDIEGLSGQLARIRARTKPSALLAAESALDISAHDHR